MSVESALAHLVAMAAIAGMAGACVSSPAYVRAADANSVEVVYARDTQGAIDDATQLARAHCARFERVARLTETLEGVARFDCVRR